MDESQTPPATTSPRPGPYQPSPDDFIEDPERVHPPTPRQAPPPQPQEIFTDPVENYLMFCLHETADAYPEASDALVYYRHLKDRLWWYDQGFDPRALKLPRSPGES